MATATSSSQTTYTDQSGQTYIDALLGGVKWGLERGNGATLTFSFPDSSSQWSTVSAAMGGYGTAAGAREPYSGFTSLTTDQKDAVRGALAQWSQVANITFTETEDSTSTVGEMRVAASSAAPSGATVWAYAPTSLGASGGDIWINAGAVSTIKPTAGNLGYFALLQQVGYALGLKRPSDDTPRLPVETDSNQYTVMSTKTSQSATIYPTSPMLYDIAAIQYLYGANTSWHTGNDSYQFSASAEVLQTLWDAGGTDTLDASNQLAAAAIDLNAGGFSSIGVKNNGALASNNVAIAYGVTIENAYGSGGADTIMGNAADNMIYGYAGGDIVYGGGGADSVNGGAGEDFAHGGGANDTLWGGQGNDTIWGGQGNDDVNGNLGNDAVNGNLGNDTLRGGQGHDTVYGGAGSDLVEGNLGDDRLAGNLGDDTLSGGSGADRFEYRSGWGQDVITDFNAADGDRIELATGTSYILSQNDQGETFILFPASSDSITLTGVPKSAFQTSWISFV